MSASDTPSDPSAPPIPHPPRIWVLHCPFRKEGSPVLGSFGRDVKPVVIMTLETWKRLGEAVPALQAMQFEVGTYGD